MRIVLRPSLSLIRPHIGVARNCPIAKEETINPASISVSPRFLATNTNGGSSSSILGGSSNTISAGADNSSAFGQSIQINTDDRFICFEGANHGRFGVNRDDIDGGLDHPIHVGTDATNGNGAHLTSGGTWTNGSSREFKDEFESLSGEQVLDSFGGTTTVLVSMPDKKWQNFSNTDMTVVDSGYADCNTINWGYIK